MAIVITELVVRAQVGTPEPVEREQTEAQRQEERARLIEDVAVEVMRRLRREQEP